MFKIRLIRNQNFTDTPVIIKLPESVEIVAGQVDEPEEARQAQVVRTSDLLADLGRRWSEAVLDLRDPLGRERYLEVKKQMLQVELMALGYSDTMQPYNHPASAARIIPAFEGFFRVVPYLQKELPFVLKDLDLGEIRRDQDSLVFMQRMQTEGTLVQHAYECVITGLEQGLANRAYAIWKRLGNAPDLHYRLGLELKDMQELNNNNATQAQETKKQVAAAVNRAMDKGVVNPAPAAPAPAPAASPVTEDEEPPRSPPAVPRPKSTPRK